MKQLSEIKIGTGTSLHSPGFFRRALMSLGFFRHALMSPALISLALFGLTALLPNCLTAQKIGYVSTETIKSKYEAYQLSEQRLNALVEEWKTELDQMQKDVEDLELELRKNRLVWTDAERQQKELEISERKRNREKYANEKFAPGGEHDKQAEILFKAVWEKIYLAIQKVSAEGGYDIVWDKSVQPLVYVNAKYDVTVKVMQQLGIDAGDLEKKQKEVIDADPRNKSLEEPRKQRSRRRSTSRDTTGQNSPTNPSTNTLESVEPRSPNNLPPAPPPPPVVPNKSPADTTKPREDEVPR